MPGPVATNRGFNLGKRNNRAYSSPAVVKKSWTDPITADIDAFVDAANGPNATTARYHATEAAGLGFSGATAFNGVRPTGQQDVARNVVITVTDAAAVVAQSGVITGLDIHGDLQTEAWSVAVATTSRTFTGAKAFSRVLQVTVTAATNASANTFEVGFGNVLGLEVASSLTSPLKEIAAGSVVTNGVVVAASTSASADQFGTYTPNTAPNGTNDYTLYYLSDNPEQS